eukprot:TRINITY_DN75225_c0_g1_i1.p1 TRINITY_DN75225_c0_g1~~TRINITY_DN75225_c0_g1_i1.p1  ORF type:complete len:162 (+),score=16.46 TRINITY_DN75225_c0_g1_i1:2-487(+)
MEPTGRLSLCMCLLYLEGARTLQNTLDTYQATGLFNMSAERFIVFLEHAQSQAEMQWREGIKAEWGFRSLDADNEHKWPDSFVKVGGKDAYRRVGKAMTACALTCRSDIIIFLEEDWEVITRPAALVELVSQKLSDYCEKEAQTWSTCVISCSMGHHFTSC